MLINGVKNKKSKFVIGFSDVCFFGQLGVDRFIMGKIGIGPLKLITFGGFGIWWLIDMILIATKYSFNRIK